MSQAGLAVNHPANSAHEAIPTDATLFIIVVGVFVAATISIALVRMTTFSESAWGCLRFTTLDSTGVLQVSSGTYIIERPFTPAKYAATVTHVPIKAGQWIYYDYVSSSGRQRNGLVDYAGSHGTLEGWADFPATIYSISPDFKYLAFNALDQSTQFQTLTIYDSTTFTQVAKVAVEGSLPTRSIYTATNGLNYADWSNDSTWFAFTHSTVSTFTLTLLSIPTGSSYTIPIASAEPSSLLFWSPRGDAIAVLGGADDTYPSLYRKVDIVARINEAWKVVYTFDTKIERSSPVSEGHMERALWTSAGDTFLILRLQPQRGSGYELITVRLGDPATSTAVTLSSAFRPGFTLRGDWFCAPSLTGMSFQLIPLADPTLPIFNVATGCEYPLASPDGKMLLAKRVPSADSPTGTWIELRTQPFSILPLPSVELSMPLEELHWIQWSKDGRLVLLFVPIAMTTHDHFDGYLVVIDTTSGHSIRLQQPIAINLFPAISPDLSRLAVWSADRQHVLLYDMHNHLLATIRSAFPNADTVLLDWNPDSTRLLMSEAYLMGRSSVSIFDRDGRAVATFPRPAPSQSWIISAAERSWTHCEPSPKLPRLNLPQ